MILGWLNLQDWKLTDNIGEVDIAGLECDGLEIAGLDNRKVIIIS